MENPPAFDPGGQTQRSSVNPERESRAKGTPESGAAQPHHSTAPRNGWEMVLRAGPGASGLGSTRALPAPPSLTAPAREVPPAPLLQLPAGFATHPEWEAAVTGPCRGGPAPCPPLPGPGDSLGAVVDQDALADGEGAVVPHQQEVKDGVCHPGSHRAPCEGTCQGHRHPDSPWDTHPKGRDLLPTTHHGHGSHKGHPASRAVSRCFTRISCSALDIPGWKSRARELWEEISAQHQARLTWS